jgi:hypothetical protein
MWAFQNVKNEPSNHTFTLVKNGYAFHGCGNLGVCSLLNICNMIPLASISSHKV